MIKKPFMTPSKTMEKYFEFHEKNNHKHEMSIANQSGMDQEFVSTACTDLKLGQDFKGCPSVELNSKPIRREPSRRFKLWYINHLHQIKLLR